jgi:MOSC domain-containing protein YiiM
MAKRGRIVAVCLSHEKGTSKNPVPSGRLMADFGLEGDAHAGTPSRQVSLLCVESIDKMRAKGVELAPGNFAENLTVEGCAVGDFAPGARIALQQGPLLEVTQIGKECHSGCAIRKLVGDCVMPREGVFARVVKGGDVAPGDTLEVIADGD